MAKDTKPPPRVKLTKTRKRNRKGVTGMEDFPRQFRHVTLANRLKYARFVAEYVKDFSAKNAMLRTGFPSYDPTVQANKWLAEGIVQFMLDKVLTEMQEEALVDRRFILRGLKQEANYHGIDGSSASRTSALRILAKIFGMEKIVTENKHSIEGGVMNVPLVASPDDWENTAGKSQDALKDAVRK